MPAIKNLALLLGSISTAYAAVGLTSTSGSYTIDTGADLTWTVSRTNGDITSLKYKGIDYQSTSKRSHINSGFGASPNVTATLLPGPDGDNEYVKVTIKSNSMPVTHYYIAKNGDNAIYMATHNTGEVSPGELRMLFRLDRNKLPLGAVAYDTEVSEIWGGTAIEGSDVYLKNGTTRSKFYSSERFIDDQVHGVTGENVGLWMVLPGTAYETASGGPFMRDINMQESDQHELYWYMNSGHIRTEPWRSGLHGPYALICNDGEKPDGFLDTSFFADLSIPGYVPERERGFVSGTTRKVDGTSVPGENRSAKAALKKPAGADPAVRNYWKRVDRSFETVVHWYNDQAQYWTKAFAGSYLSPAMKPGNYTVKMYRNEFPVYIGNVTVTADTTVVHNIEADEPAHPSIWKLGEFDGQPFEFRNGLKFLRMHPSDSRMDSWNGSYIVGQSTPLDFPMAAFKGMPAPTINFTVANITEPSGVMLRIATTFSFNGGRPSVKFNDYSFPAPPVPVKINSRAITRGGYRGYGEVYTFNVPTGLIQVGENSIAIGVASGSSGTEFLAPSFIFDAVELVGTGIELGAPYVPVEETETASATVTATATTAAENAA